MRRLFPPPAYERPNDVFFEVTGVLQLVLGIVTGHQLYGLLLERRKPRSRPATRFRAEPAPTGGWAGDGR